MQINLPWAVGANHHPPCTADQSPNYASYSAGSSIAVSEDDNSLPQAAAPLPF